jgi:KDO2-lipid IV(A) lauroyltransferase
LALAIAARCGPITLRSMNPGVVITTFSFSVLRGIAHVVPPALGTGVSRLGARLHYHLAPGKRAAVQTNLTHVLDWQGVAPDRQRVEELSQRTFRSHGQLVYEWLRDGAGVRIAFRGLDHLEALRRRRRGAVIITCHLGNWEVAALELAARGFVLNVVTGEQLGPLGAAVRRHKARHGIRVVRLADGMRPLYRALERGELVVLLIDGDVYRRADDAPFFAAPTPLPFGALRLARATGAALIPAAMVRTGAQRYRVLIETPVASDGEDASIMRRLLAPLESQIAAHPHQWCLFRPLWTLPPAGRAA